jgi:hypothetical protein
MSEPAIADQGAIFRNKCFAVAGNCAIFSRLSKKGASAGAFREGARQRDFFICIDRKPLKSPDSEK